MNRRDLETEQRLKRRLDELGRAWREGGDGPEPPDLVDQAVLNRARRAVAPPAWRQPGRWLRGFAATAVVVLAVFVVLQQRAPTPTLPQAAPPADAVRARDAAPPEAGEPPAARFEATPAGGDAREMRAAKSAAPTDADEAQAESTAAPSPPAALRRVAEPAQDEATDRLEEAASLAAPEARSREAGARQGAVEGAGENAGELPAPEDWLARLQALRAAGDEEAFARELERFRAAYPEHPLPEGWVR